MDIFTESRNSGLQAADPPDDQLDFNACARGLIKSRNNLLITQWIHLRNNPCWFALPCMLSFPVYQLQEPISQPDRCKDQFIPIRRRWIAGQHIKDRCRILSDWFRTSKQSHVCIQLRCLVIIIAGAEMHISSDTILISPDDQGDLTMSLQAPQTVNNMASGLLQHLCPQDIILLIKTGFQLHKDRYLLAVLRCCCQRCNDRWIAADAVKCLFDSQNIRILSCLADELNNRRKCLIRMVQENILPADLGKYVLFRIHPFHRLWCIFAVSKVIKPFKTADFHQKCQIQRPSDTINRFFCHI